MFRWSKIIWHFIDFGTAGTERHKINRLDKDFGIIRVTGFTDRVIPVRDGRIEIESRVTVKA